MMDKLVTGRGGIAWNAYVTSIFRVLLPMIDPLYPDV